MTFYGDHKETVQQIKGRLFPGKITALNNSCAHVTGEHGVLSTPGHDLQGAPNRSCSGSSFFLQARRSPFPVISIMCLLFSFLVTLLCSFLLESRGASSYRNVLQNTGKPPAKYREVLEMNGNGKEIRAAYKVAQYMQRSHLEMCFYQHMFWFLIQYDRWK